MTFLTVCTWETTVLLLSNFKATLGAFFFQIPYAFVSLPQLPLHLIHLEDVFI